MINNLFVYEEIHYHGELTVTLTDVTLKKKIGDFKVGEKIKSLEIDFYGGLLSIFSGTKNFEFELDYIITFPGSDKTRRSIKYKYDCKGYDSDGYNCDGYDCDGYDCDGYDCDGYDRKGSVDGRKYKYDRKGYDRYGYDCDGYNRGEYDRGGVYRYEYDYTKHKLNKE